MEPAKRESTQVDSVLSADWRRPARSQEYYNEDASKSSALNALRRGPEPTG